MKGYLTSNQDNLPVFDLVTQQFSLWAGRRPREGVLASWGIIHDDGTVDQNTGPFADLYFSGLLC